jgi:hypothetical protein
MLRRPYSEQHHRGAIRPQQDGATARHASGEAERRFLKDEAEYRSV